MSTQSASAIHIPGIPVPRTRQAVTTVGAGLMFAVAPLLPVFVVATEVEGATSAWQAIVEVSEGFRVASATLLAVVVSSVLVLRITFAVVDRRELNAVEHVAAERRFETGAVLCVLIAVPFAAIALPAMLVRVDRVGEAVGVVAVAGLTCYFAFWAGASWAPNALVQKELFLTSRERARGRVAAASGARAVTIGRAWWTLAGWVAALIVGLPAGAAVAMIAQSADAGSIWTTVWLIVVLVAGSWYGVFLVQGARYYGRGVVGWLVRAAGLVFAGAGWLAMVVVEIVGWAATQDAGWGWWALGFLAAGVLFVSLALGTPGRWRGSVAASVVSILERGDGNSIDRWSAQIDELDKIIDAHLGKDAPRGWMRRLLAWLSARA